MTRSRNADLARAALVVCALVACALSLVLAAAPARAQQTLGLAVGDTLELTRGELRGLAWLDDGTAVALVAASTADSVGADGPVTLQWLAPGGAVIREHDVTGMLSRGLAFDGKWFWSLGDASAERPATLYKIESDTLFVAEEYPTPGHRPRDLAWADDGLWLVDRDRGRLDRFDPETEEVTRSYATTAFSPTGVAGDGRDLWISDLATGLIYRLNSGGTRWTGTVAASDWFSRGQELQLHWRDGSLLVTPAGTGRIIRARPE